jgi:ABC-type xylose transport system permease subunit
MLLFLATFAALFALPLLGVVLGYLQLGWYRWRKTPADDVPFFGILMFRGMLVGMALIAIGTIASHLAAAR